MTVVRFSIPVIKTRQPYSGASDAMPMTLMVHMRYHKFNIDVCLDIREWLMAMKAHHLRPLILQVTQEIENAEWNRALEYCIERCPPGECPFVDELMIDIIDKGDANPSNSTPIQGNISSSVSTPTPTKTTTNATTPAKRTSTVNNASASPTKIAQGVKATAVPKTPLDKSLSHTAGKDIGTSDIKGNEEIHGGGGGGRSRSNSNTNSRRVNNETKDRRDKRAGQQQQHTGVIIKAASTTEQAKQAATHESNIGVSRGRTALASNILLS